ncbi:hypothetical protein D9613_007732 [Agrocybe pediades]|uniref:Receptor-activated Ca2+-permeable cation channel n=1 Tax=Agrocybe pediades TaxID=84607 RepID=A0A8H4QNC2_9AGAR|nr:hypothetical protein D9613_007732 [Agrocybe pediades]
MDPEQQSASLLPPSVNDLASIKVFPLIPALKQDVINTIDSALSWEQLTAADINFSIVRPIVNRYARLKNIAVVYACLVVRSYFLAEAETDLAFAGVMFARASLCEILAMKLLSRFAKNYLQLVAVLTTTWNPLAGAPPHVVEEVKQMLHARDDDMDSAQSAIEMAISTDAKAFLASPVTQKVVNDIYSGRVVFSVATNRSILADNYKPRAIEIYNPHNAPFLDHYRLRVPRYGAYLEFLNFAFLWLTFVFCLLNRDKTHVTFWEMAFIVFGIAFALEEYTASTEHGWIIYIANMWNAFDFSFIVVFLTYLGLRVQGLSTNNEAASDMAFDILACGACILFPRLAFFAVSNNTVVLSLRAMIAQFVFFIAIASICFSGLLFTLWTLASADPVGHDHWSFKSIAWLMVQIWFGNTYLSFAQASSFHPVLGPILMTIFAALSNTLLLTILISILSNTVARIDANATQEHLFQYTIATIEGVKSDALFSYQPPFNILAFIILKPASWFLTPRQLHSLNVFLIKTTSLPQLLVIATYERYFSVDSEVRATGREARQSIFSSLPRHIKHMPLLEAFVGSMNKDLVDAIFELDSEVGEGMYEEVFGGEEDYEGDLLGLRSIASREDVRSGGHGKGSDKRRGESPGHSRSKSPTPRITRRRPTSLEPLISTGGPSGAGLSSNQASPRHRVLSALTPEHLEATTTSPAEITGSTNSNSPLARLFGNRFHSISGGLSVPPTSPSRVVFPTSGSAESSLVAAEASLKHIEAMLDTVGKLPVNKLKEEMKELQDRQARIENLLLMLTRGMRNDTPSTHRQGTT